MRKIRLLAGIAIGLFFTQVLVAQEKFIDIRQKMADDLTAVKKSVKNNDWPEAVDDFKRAKENWENEVKPMIIEGEKRDLQFKEYFERISQVDEDLKSLQQLLEDKNDKEVDQAVNAIIWGISHHPRGFAVSKPRYSIWDWVLGLGIGGGFCLFITFFGLYLRRSYYRRYKKEKL